MQQIRPLGETGRGEVLHPLDPPFSTRTEFLYVRAIDVVVLPQSGPVRFSTFFSSDFAKSSPVDSAHFLDFARAQLSQGDLSEEVER